MIKCHVCNSMFIDKGRARDGRRAYRCNVCHKEWTTGLQGVKQRFSAQRPGNQFQDTGAGKGHQGIKYPREEKYES